MPWQPTHHQPLRDLQWSIDSPSLIDCKLPAWSEMSIADVDENKLHHFLQNRFSHRVGYYFESLVHFWLKHIRGFEVTGNRLQIQHDTRTIGELDFLFRDENGELNHWEVAVKFYLYHSDQTVAGSHLIGPNAADTFERKMQRLFKHQLPLSKKYYPEVSQRHAFVKGRIFYHPKMPARVETPALLSADHLRDSWIFSHEQAWLDQVDFDAAMVLQKPWWLSPVEVPNADEIQSPETLKLELKLHFETSSNPLLISLLKKLPGSYRETQRLFVVDEQWPMTSRGEIAD